MPRKPRKSDLSARKGHRYTKTEKAEILAYVDEVNAEKGRGGIRAASRKFGVSPLSISNWIRNADGSSMNGGDPGGSSREMRVLSDLMELAREMEVLRERLEKKRKRFDELKGQL